ncbi:hypothetical protein predicted by Glimmer/Critica [Acetobacter ghanensis]|uniref:Uncharacterized protein n=1 Tax=Acetobacter ghanensis TaxID=431306 RepID=A0A0U5F7K1_9PROT|nr:hypothetical protein predicted by Glimmer/Critica [Acetobacter ghanensis]
MCWLGARIVCFWEAAPDWWFFRDNGGRYEHSFADAFDISSYNRFYGSIPFQIGSDIIRIISNLPTAAPAKNTVA